MYVKKNIDAFDNVENTLIVYNAQTDYGTQGPSENNFEILVYGLHIPGDFKVENVGDNVVITLNQRYIDFDNVTLNDIYVFGKFIDIPIATEDNLNITTEDGLDIII
jgi:hypothetical protein